jgi:hypothetical protein
MRGPVTWEVKPLVHPVQSSDHCKWRCDVDSEENLIFFIAEAAAGSNWQFLFGPRYHLAKYGNGFFPHLYV